MEFSAVAVLWGYGPGMNPWYGLDGKPVDMLTAEGLLVDGDARRVAHTRLFTDRGIVDVSTIFLVLDHNWSGEGPPVLWETMVFGGPVDQEQWRYASREDAARGHDETVSWARAAVDVAGATVISDDHVGGPPALSTMGGPTGGAVPGSEGSSSSGAAPLESTHAPNSPHS